MRIGVTGTHGSGKTTLIEDFVAAAPACIAVPEPFWLLAEHGTPLADGSSIADLETQLEASCSVILDTAGADVVFDRCPLDFIAYLEVVAAAERFEWTPDGKLLRRIEKALARLTLIVFVPLVHPDEISVRIERPKLRASVDRRLKTMLREDDLGLLADGPRVIEIAGTRAARLAAMLEAVGAG